MKSTTRRAFGHLHSTTREHQDAAGTCRRYAGGRSRSTGGGEGGGTGVHVFFEAKRVFMYRQRFRVRGFIRVEPLAFSSASFAPVNSMDGSLSDREFRGRRENLTEFLRWRAPHNDAPSPHAGPFRAIRRLATQGDSLASTSQRVYRLDRGACTPVAADQILSRESTAKARQEYHPNRTRLISRRHVRRRYVRSHRARDLRSSSAITGIARPSLPPVRSTRGRHSLACRVAGTFPTALENTDDIRDRPTDAPFPASLDRQMRCPRSSWTWERTR